MAYANKLIKSYTVDTLVEIKHTLKSLDTETVRVDLDELFKLNRIKPDSPQENSIRAFPSVLEMVRMAGFIYNQKAMVALTKEKNKLALQNLVRSISVTTKIVVSTGDLFMQFVLLVNTGFVLYKLDRVADAISFINQALLLADEALSNLTSGKPNAAKECMEAARTYTFALFFVRGGDNFGTKGKDPDAEQVDSSNRRPKGTFGSCCQKVTSCSLKFLALTTSTPKVK